VISSRVILSFALIPFSFSDAPALTARLNESVKSVKSLVFLLICREVTSHAREMALEITDFTDFTYQLAPMVSMRALAARI
jgi:hypothetical protein